MSRDGPRLGAISVYGSTDLSLRFRTNASGCASREDCHGGVCRSDGLCDCPSGYSGADCSYAGSCLGDVVSTSETGNFSSSGGALGAGEQDTRYGNLANCSFSVRVPGARFVRFLVRYDLEDSHDFVEVLGGAHGALLPIVRLTGSSDRLGASHARMLNEGQPQRVTVAAHEGVAQLRFASDEVGRRGGFVVSYEADGERACRSDEDCSGHGRCGEAGRCGCDGGWYGEACSSPSCLAFNSDGGGRIDSQAEGLRGGIAAMADCVWPMQAEPGAVGVRLTWDDFDLEPFDTLEEAGDVALLETADGRPLALKAGGSRLAVVRCDVDDHCDKELHPWMRGTCEAGLCAESREDPRLPEITRGCPRLGRAVRRHGRRLRPAARGAARRALLPPPHRPQRPQPELPRRARQLGVARGVPLC